MIFFTILALIQCVSFSKTFITAEENDCDNSNCININIIVQDTYPHYCSGRGTCHCGVCKCNPRSNPNEVVNGKFCECDNFSCDRSGGEICSGLDHGECICGLCKCKENWSGHACECTKNNETCMPGLEPATAICNGNGACTCGFCSCNEGYFGKYCQFCETCQSACKTFKECVLCTAGSLNQQCEHQCNDTTVTLIDELISPSHKLDQLCLFIDDLNCKFEFLVKYSQSAHFNTEVFVLQNKNCPENSSIPSMEKDDEDFDYRQKFMMELVKSAVKSSVEEALEPLKQQMEMLKVRQMLIIRLLNEIKINV